MRNAAYYDGLTGLPNRSLFVERLQQSLLRARRAGHQGAVLHIDLDDFHLLNDSLGRSAADQFLRDIAQGIAKRLRAVDTVSHFYADEYLLLLDKLSTERQISAGEVMRIAQEIQDFIAQPHHIGSHPIHLTACIGIIVFPSSGPQEAEELMRRAELALSEAKRRGKNQIQLYQKHMHLAVQKRLDLQDRLGIAVEENQFELFYQPKVELTNARLHGAESLIRWRDPNQGLISPEAFIPLLENSGLIRDVGKQILTQACRQLRAWIDQGLWHSGWRLAVNVSPVQLMADDCVPTILDTVKQYDIRPDQLELELTESVFMGDNKIPLMQIQALHDQGFIMVIDDFGTGYSSLAYLHRFPISVLKIDISFVRNVATFTDAQGIAQTIINFAQQFGMGTVAEGIERISQHEALRSLGADLGQGFLYAHPLSAHDMTTELQHHNQNGKRPNNKA